MTRAFGSRAFHHVSVSLYRLGAPPQSPHIGVATEPRITMVHMYIYVSNGMNRSVVTFTICHIVDRDVNCTVKMGRTVIKVFDREAEIRTFRRDRRLHAIPAAPFTGSIDRSAVTIKLQLLILLRCLGYVRF